MPHIIEENEIKLFLISGTEIPYYFSIELSISHLRPHDYQDSGINRTSRWHRECGTISEPESPASMSNETKKNKNKSNLRKNITIFIFNKYITMNPNINHFIFQRKRENHISFLPLNIDHFIFQVSHSNFPNPITEHN